MWGIRSRYGAIKMENSVSSVNFQQCLYYNVQLAVAYGAIVALNIYNKKTTYRYNSSLNASLVVPIFIFWAVAEVSRLYFGYVGNLMEKVSGPLPIPFFCLLAILACTGQHMTHDAKHMSLEGTGNKRLPPCHDLPLHTSYMLLIFCPGACISFRRHRWYNHAHLPCGRACCRQHGLQSAYQQANGAILQALPGGRVKGASAV